MLSRFFKKDRFKDIKSDVIFKSDSMSEYNVTFCSNFWLWYFDYYSDKNSIFRHYDDRKVDYTNITIVNVATGESEIIKDVKYELSEKFVRFNKVVDRPFPEFDIDVIAYADNRQISLSVNEENSIPGTAIVDTKYACNKRETVLLNLLKEDFMHESTMSDHMKRFSMKIAVYEQKRKDIAEKVKYHTNSKTV